MTAPSEKSSTARRLQLFPLAAWMLLASIGYLPTRSISGPEGVIAMLAAQALVLGIVYATMLWTMHLMAEGDAQSRFRAAWQAGMIRFLLTVSGAALFTFCRFVEHVPFLVWLAISYVLLIKVETLAFIRWGRRLETDG